MLLNSLEIKGFKSFGDKVLLHFDEGITGIVGPNGCGKSNVVDAIRWVLGEQKTRALRSEKMENIIFNGTRNRKPLQMAEVSLTFSNNKGVLPTEFNQVTITRRYYRSGESEYLLNGIACRLKDITNLFLDTGIGSDSYAIIELKMVDDLLNDRENSRRNMFEEAAGVSKFKLRKKETHRKLEDTSKDLERVEDLLYEITKNLKSLEKQAKQAEQYFKLKEEYKAVSIDLARFSLASQFALQQEIQRQIVEKQDLAASLMGRLSQAEAGLESEKTALAQWQNLVTTRHKSLNEITQQIRDYEAQKQLKNERLKALNDKNRSQKASMEQDLQFLKTNARKTAEFQEKLAALQSEESYLKTALDKSHEAITQLKAEITKNQEAHLQGNQLLKLRQQEVFSLEKKAEIAKVQLQKLKEEFEKSTSESALQQQNKDQYQEQKAALSTLLEALQTQWKAAQQFEVKLDADQDALNSQIEKLKEQSIKLHRKIDALQNEYNLTKSLVDNLEGFPEAIRFLKKNAEWKYDAPLLSDIITTTDEKYRVAFENFLEPYLNYYVVNTSQQAYEAITLLAKTGKGRAHFFILDQIPDSLDLFQTEGLADCVPALDIAEFDARYRPLVKMLLGNVLIAENGRLPEADYPGTIISITGGITKGPRQLSGGSVGIFEGKRIGRALNLEKLQQELNKLAKQASEIKDQQTQLQLGVSDLRAQSKKDEIATLQKEISKTEQELITLTVKSDQVAALLASVSNQKEDIAARITSLEDELQADSPALIEAKEALIEADKVLKTLSETSGSLNDSLQTGQIENTQFQTDLARKEAEIKAQQQEIYYRENEKRGLEKRLEKTKEENALTEQELENLLSIETIGDEELQTLILEKETVAESVREAEQTYYDLRATIDGNEKQSRETQRERERTQEEIAALQQKLADSKLSLTAVTERLKVEHEVIVNQELMAGFDPNLFTEQDLKDRVQSIRQRMEKMGPINPMAMEAYCEIHDRYEFISGQKKDLEEARKSLLDTISEIDTVASETFMSTYEAIRANFQKVFRSLFTDEDTCDLVLADPKNPLESAIEIIARPKGKRPLTINQLSGGEKTLTAISLLFSIYLIKPAPFCIFDEVDAPLDDANIDKFNNIIRDFSSDSQFIIVTHNKRTMISTDVIYGITMLEAGVSRVIPVDLRELG